MTSAMSPAEFLADLEQIALPPAEAARLFGVHRSTVYRWLDGSARIPEPAKRILKLEVEACQAHSYLAADGSRYWQGFRHGHEIGPPCSTREAAFHYALEFLIDD